MMMQKGHEGGATRPREIKYVPSRFEGGGGAGVEGGGWSH